MTKTLLLLILCYSTGFVFSISCKSSSRTKRADVKSEVDTDSSYATEAELPSCNTESQGKVYWVTNKNAQFYCTADGKWLARELEVDGSEMNIDLPQ